MWWCHSAFRPFCWAFLAHNSGDSLVRLTAATAITKRGLETRMEGGNYELCDDRDDHDEGGTLQWMSFFFSFGFKN